MGRLDPRRRQGPQGRQNPESHHIVPILAGGGQTRAGGRRQKLTPHPTNQGADARWQRRRGATGRNGDGDRGGSGADENRIRRRGAPKSTPHQRGFCRGRGRTCWQGPRHPRRGYKRRRRVLACTDPDRGSGCSGGIPSEREAGAVVRHSRPDDRGGRHPKERESAGANGRQGDGGKNTPRTAARA